MNNLVLLAGLVSLPWTPADAADRSLALKSLHNLPFSFVNTGNGTWTAQGNGRRVDVTAAGATFTTSSTSSGDLKIAFVNARTEAPASPDDPLPGKFNYLIGSDRSRWIQNRQMFRQLRFQDIYPGVDVIWHSASDGLEYDLALKPLADPSRIAIRFEGAVKLRLDNGDLRIETPVGPLTMRVPVVYQESRGARERIAAKYVIRSANEVGFELAGYDKTRAVVIDPTLVYASWLDVGNVMVSGMARDAQGNLYVAGNASWLPTASGFQANLGTAIRDPFVIKFDPTGTNVLYATFVGGTTDDYLSGVAVDTNGNVVATGSARSTDFPVVNAAQSTCGDFTDSSCAFVFRLNPSGNALIYSTYVLGASGAAVAADGSGSAYVTGNVAGSLIQPFQTTPGAYSTGQYYDTFVEKYAADGTVQYATMLGTIGNSTDAIVVDQQGYAYVAGTAAATYAQQGVPGVRQWTGGGGVFVAKLGSDGRTLPWAAVLGGHGIDTPHSLARDASGVLYVAGETTSPDLPVTAGVIQPAIHGQSDGFIASVNSDGLSFGFVTYFGGIGNDQIYALAPTSGGQIVVAGDTMSPDFPVSNAIQPTIGGNGATLFETTNYGATWTPVGTGLAPGPATVILTVDPSNPATIVAISAGALFRSTNSGHSWSAVGPASAYFLTMNGLSRSLYNSQVLYALAQTGQVYRSSDGGVTWTTGGTLWYPLTIVASATNANTVLVIDGRGFVNVSTDGGATFTPNANQFYDVGTAVASPDGSIYLTAKETVSKSTDTGVTWQTPSFMTLGSSLLAPAVSVCTATPAVLYWANNYLSKSADGGMTWTASVPAYRATVAPSNCQVVYTSSSSLPPLKVSNDGGATWTSASGGLTESQYGGLTVDPSNPAHAWVAGGLAPDGFIAKLSNDGRSLLWSTYYGGSDADYLYGVVTDGAGNVWIARQSVSVDIPVTGAAVPTNHQYALILAEISDSTAACSYHLSPASSTSYGAGVINFSVTAPSGCSWTATPSSGWITAVNPSPGTGSSPVAAVVSANTTNATRTGTIAIGDQSFTITQPSSTCQYTLDNNTFRLPSGGGQFVVNVTAGAGCNWSVSPTALTIVSGASGVGNGPVTLSAPPNSGPRPTVFVATVGGQYVIVTVLENCTYSLSPLTFDGGLSAFTVGVTASNSACGWTASTPASWLYFSNQGSGTGSSNLIANSSKNTTFSARTALITIGSQTFTLTQNVWQPALAATISHVGNLTQGQMGVQYSVTVTNNGAPMVDTVTVTENLPSGLTLVSMSGDGWTCATNICTRTSAMGTGVSFPPITVTVNVTNSASSPQVNSVGVVWSTGSSSNTDATIINRGSISDNAFFVGQLYLDLFDRNADPSGLTYWAAFLNSGSMTRTQLAADFFTSPEFAEGGLEIIKDYIAVLGRDPDFGGWLNWFTAWQQGRRCSIS